jgi:hypothetical protein
MMQARDGMFELRRAIQRHFGDSSKEARAIVSCAVVFTDVVTPPLSPEAETWEFIDRRALSTRPIGRTIENVLRLNAERLGRPSATGPDTSTITAIRAYLRPDFDMVVARSTTIARAEQQLVKLTEDQFDVVDNIELNDRCFVGGAAGTGKTLIALEMAKRAKAAGARPVVLCFNKLLGRWIEHSLPVAGAVRGSYHRVLKTCIESSSVRDAFAAGPADGKFAEWPLFALEALSESGSIGDLLIVDEAQDLCSDEDLCVFDAMLEGGLAGGRWVFLGDFTRQAIFGCASSSGGLAAFEQLLRERSPHYTELRLTTNCRNTRQIAEETAMLTGFDELPYKLGSADGAPVDFRYWRSSEDEVRELMAVLREFQRDGVSPSDITLLSPRRLDKSVARALNHSGFAVNDVAGHSGSDPDSAVRFSTIQAFKGMETPVGVMIDLKGIEDLERQALFYTGMSRARSHLVMLVHDSFRAHVGATIRRKLSPTH